MAVVNSLKAQLEAVLNANPEGINQWSSSKDVHTETDRISRKYADEKSESANSKSDVAEKSGSKRDHAKAADAHDKASSEHRDSASSSGTEEGREYHRAKEKEHDAKAERHREKVDNQLTTNHGPDGCHCGGKCDECKSSVANRLREALGGDATTNGRRQMTNNRRGRLVMNKKSATAAALTCNALIDLRDSVHNRSSADAAWEHEKAALAHLEATRVNNVADAQAHAACRADHLRMAEMIRNGETPAPSKRLWNIVTNAPGVAPSSPTAPTTTTPKMPAAPKPPAAPKAPGGFTAPDDNPDTKEQYAAQKDQKNAAAMASMGAYNACAGGGAQAEDVQVHGSGKVLAKDYSGLATNDDDMEGGGEGEDTGADETMNFGGPPAPPAPPPPISDPDDDGIGKLKGRRTKGASIMGGDDTLNANPEGHNQYTKGGGSGGKKSQAEKVAGRSTEVAHDLSETAQSGKKVDHTNAKDAHLEAHEDHLQAASAALKRGDRGAAKEHMAQAAEHLDHAKWHQAKTTLWGRIKSKITGNANDTLNEEVLFCPRDGTELEDDECPECGWSPDDGVENALGDRPRHSSGRYLPHGAGTGKGPVHDGAVSSFSDLVAGHKTAGYVPPPSLKPTPYITGAPEDASDELHEDDAHAQIIGRQVTPDGRNIADIRRPSTVIGSDDDGGHSDVDEPYDPISAMRAVTKNANPEGRNQYSKDKASATDASQKAFDHDNSFTVGESTPELLRKSRDLHMDAGAKWEKLGVSDKAARHFRTADNHDSEAMHIERGHTRNDRRNTPNEMAHCPKCGNQMLDGRCECGYTAPIQRGEGILPANNVRQTVSNRALRRIAHNCGGAGGTRGPCKGGAISRKANAASASGDHQSAADAHSAAADAHQKLAESATNAKAKAFHEMQASSHSVMSGLHQQDADDARKPATPPSKMQVAHDASQKANASGDKEDHTAAAAAHDSAAKEAFAKSKAGATEGEKQSYAAVAKEHNDLKKFHTGKAKNPTGNSRVFNMDPTACHDASKDAAKATLDTEHPQAMDHSLAAVQASGADDPDNAAAASSHMDAAKAHDKAAVKAYGDGDADGAAAHEQAASMHRRAVGMHKNVDSSGDSQTMNFKRAERMVVNDWGAAFEAAIQSGKPRDQAAAMASKAEGGYTGEDTGGHGKESASAFKATAHADSTKSKGAHLKAASAHREAAEHHRGEGNDDMAKGHADKARYHTQKAKHMARNARQRVTNSYVQQQQEMVGNMNRQELIGYLVQNAGEVPTALEGLSDRALRTLCANQAMTNNGPSDFGRFDTPSGSFKSTYRQAGGDGGEDEYYKRGVKTDHPVPIDGPNAGGHGGSDDDDEDAPEDWTEDDIDSGDTKNSRGRNMTENEWMAQAPPAMQEMAREFKQHRTRQVNNLIRRLVANERNPQRRQAVGNKWFERAKGKAGFELLKETVALLPTHNSSDNGIGSIPTINEIQPSYLGAAGTMVDNYAGNSSDGSIGGAPLALPTLNWAEENKGTLEKLGHTARAN